ncbi:P-loop NTPase family protein [Chitinophaga silvisoli]|nr:ATPase [Chitinophaga silvisoli]
MITITTSLFNYKQILPVLADKGRILFGAHFRIYPEDLKVIIPVIAWFLHDEEVARQFDIDLHKGIFLGGPIGTGKTQIMQLMKCIVPRPLNYEMKHCDRISEEYTLKGPSMLYNYIGAENSDKYNHRIWCFDDLGSEHTAHHYGSNCQVMKKILLGRYELFTKFGTITHVTSSLTTSAIEQRYGTDVRSRMREMFNRITFDKESRDKRGYMIAT